MRFSSKKKGWVVGSISKRERVVDSILVYTDDGGDSWRRQRAPSRVELIHIDFVSDKRGWIVGDGGTILFTRDAGASWTKQNVGTTGTLYHVDFRNDKDGWVVGERGTILRTTDGGETWLTIPTNLNVTLLSIQFASDDEGLGNWSHRYDSQKHRRRQDVGARRINNEAKPLLAQFQQKDRMGSWWRRGWCCVTSAVACEQPATVLTDI